MKGMTPARFTLAMALMFALVAGVTPSAAGVSPRAVADLDDELGDILREIEDLERQLDDVDADHGELVESILATRDRLQEADANLTEAETALRDVRLSLAENQFLLQQAQQRLQAGYEAIASTRLRIDEGRDDARAWVLQRYMRQDDSAATSVISAEHVSEVGRVMYLLNEAAERTNASIDRYRALVEEEGRQQARIEEQERDLIVTGDTLNAAEARQAELTLEREARSQVVDDELALQRSLLATLDGAIADFETELDALAGEQRRLEELIDSGGGVGGAAPGLLVRPVPGRITSPFGPRVHPILGYTKMHTGLDMSAPLGQPIRSAAGGKVILAGSNGGYGLTIVIDHGGGMTTVYAHQSRLLVSAGDTVDAGDTIGESGSTGLSTGPHLHFEVRIGGQPADPEPYL